MRANSRRPTFRLFIRTKFNKKALFETKNLTQFIRLTRVERTSRESYKSGICGHGIYFYVHLCDDESNQLSTLAASKKQANPLISAITNSNEDFKQAIRDVSMLLRESRISPASFYFRNTNPPQPSPHLSFSFSLRKRRSFSSEDFVNGRRFDVVVREDF